MNEQSGGELLLLFLVKVVFAMLLIGWIPAVIAKLKGRSFWAWWLYGGLLFIIALPHSFLARSKEQLEAELKKEEEKEEERRAQERETATTDRCWGCFHFQQRGNIFDKTPGFCTKHQRKTFAYLHCADYQAKQGSPGLAN